MRAASPFLEARCAPDCRGAALGALRSLVVALGRDARELSALAPRVWGATADCGARAAAAAPGAPEREALFKVRARARRECSNCVCGGCLCLCVRGCVCLCLCLCL